MSIALAFTSTNKYKMRHVSIQRNGIATLAIGFILIAIHSITFENSNANDHQGVEKIAMQTIEEVLKENTNELMSLPGVVGTAEGICNHKPCIKVFVIKKTPELNKKIPGTLKGFQVTIEETGALRALPNGNNGR